MKRLIASALLTLSTLAAHAAPDGACQGFYDANWQPTIGKVTVPYGNPPKPVKGVQTAESAFNTCLVRVTDHAMDGLVGFGRNDYSRRQAFNADNTLMLVYSLDGAWHLYDARTYAHMGAVPGLAGDAEPQWNPTKPNKLRYIPTAGDGMKLYERNLTTGTVATLADFSGPVKARWPGATWVSTKSEGSPSADGRYWCFLAGRYESPVVTTYGFFTYDLATNTIVAMRDKDPGYDINHVSMSPSGDYCVVGGDIANVRSYPRDLSSYTVLANLGEHSDIGIGANGHDIFVSVDYQSAAGDVYMVDLQTGVRTVLFPTYLDHTATAMHFSAKAFDRPGWFVLSTAAEYASGAPYTQQWLHRKVALVQMAANPLIFNIAHTQNDYQGYWTEPAASISRNAEKIVYNSNWNNPSSLDVDDYMVQIPASRLP
jgi:hypothetical protein